MSEVQEFWAHNRAAALQAAAKSPRPYDRPLKEAFTYFEQRARQIPTNEGPFYDVLHDAMQGHLKPDTDETIAYAVHLPAPYEPGAINVLANNPAISPTVRRMLATEPTNVEPKMRAVLQALCSEYHAHCSQLLQAAGPKTLVLTDPRQQVSEQATGFDVARFLQVPTVDRYVPNCSSLTCGFPDPRQLPAMRDALGGINPYRKSVVFGAFVGECLNFPSRYDIGHTFGMSMLPFDQGSTQDERNVGATHYNLIYDRLITELRLLNDDPEHNAGVLPLRTQVIAGMDLAGKYEALVGGAMGYRAKALLECPECVIFPAKTLDAVREKVLKLLS